ncbi:hypothetical protein M758_12G075000 [Ceratodon purpureus]|nr:hypothetical protein M758_12G075000 [Ceratodon purpureus]
MDHALPWCSTRISSLAWAWMLTLYCLSDHWVTGQYTTSGSKRLILPLGPGRDFLEFDYEKVADLF